MDRTSTMAAHLDAQHREQVLDLLNRLIKEVTELKTQVAELKLKKKE